MILVLGKKMYGRLIELVKEVPDCLRIIKPKFAHEIPHGKCFNLMVQPCSIDLGIGTSSMGLTGNTLSI